MWAQIKAHVEDTGADLLPDDALHSWFLDPGIGYRPGPRVRVRNSDPLFINTVGSWDRRPEADTAIPNLFLAGDYVRTTGDLATMESANESGRRAVNALLATAGSKAAPVALFERYTAPEFAAPRQQDAERYARGEPHAMDTPWP